MTKPSTEQAPPPNKNRGPSYEPNVILDGYDNDHFYARVRSHTYPGTFYEIEGNCRTGEVRCECMDAIGRRKRGDVVRWHRTGLFGGCKHLDDLGVELDALLALLDWGLI